MEVLIKDVEGITMRGTSDAGKLILEVPSKIRTSKYASQA
jgi:hypothetical protein